MFKYFLLLVMIISVGTDVQAQLLRRLKNRVQEKVEQRVEDKIVEEVSEEIARRAMRPIDAAIDNLFREAYKEQYGEEYDESNELDAETRVAMMSSVLANVYGQVDLPESYQFDFTIDIEAYGFGDKKNSQKVQMMFPQSGKYFAMNNPEDDQMLTVLDMTNDQVAIFNKKERTVFGMKSVMRMAKSIAMSNAESYAYTIDKSGKKKKVAGYNCDGYSFTTDEEKGEFYMTNDLPFDWGNYFESFFDQAYGEYYDSTLDETGMLMYSEAKRINDGEKSKWEVKKVNASSTTIKCSDYKSGIPR